VRQPARLALVAPSAPASRGFFFSGASKPDVRAAAEGLRFPNGMVMTPDGKTLILAETYGMCLTAFDVGADGALSNQRVWAQLIFPPDGICLDADGRVWVGCPVAGFGMAVLVGEGGTVHRIVPAPKEYGVIAVALGATPGGQPLLFLLEAKLSNPAETQPGNGRITVVEVGVGGAGSP
jgi:sugar lactone lactonase YvrE